MKAYPSRYSGKPLRFLIFATFFVGWCFFEGCTTQKKAIIITPHEQAVATVKLEREITEHSLKCITCHKERGVTHSPILDWEGSKHARRGVGCEVCHINLTLEPAENEAAELEYVYPDRSNCDDKRVHRQVIAVHCGKCHTKQYNEFLKSRHSIGWKRMLECTKRLSLTKDIYSERCEQCHNIQFKCDSCHTRHTFNTTEAKIPEACRTCHMGSDQPHYDMYISSRHGAVYTSSQSDMFKEPQPIQSLRSPVCVTCHMPQGTHDISFGLAYGSSVRIGTSYIDINGIAVDETELTKRRNDMLSVCNTCHSPRFAEKTLSNADAIRRNVENDVQEGMDIITGLEKDALLFPSVSEITNTLTLGHPLILGNPELLKGKSRVYYLFSQLTNGASIAWKGAYHMNPNYTYFFGMTELKINLDDIREETRKLREEAELSRKMGIKLR